VETPETLTLKGYRSELREGLAALKEGKKLEEARISIRAGDNDFTMVLKATWFSFGSFEMSPIPSSGEAEAEEDVEASFLEKKCFIEEGMEIVDDLFGYFLKLRISEEWETNELPALRRWVSTASE
jgi:hypothetical protein